MGDNPLNTSPDDAQSDVTRARQYCLNCGSGLDDKYCAACGQKNHNYNEPFREVIEEFLSEHFNFDNLFFRSILPLLFRPGFLSTEYVAGRRASFITPLRLYIFSSILLFFLAWTFAPSPAVHIGHAAGDKAATAAEIGKIMHNPDLSEEQKKELASIAQGKIPKVISGKVFGRKFKANTADLSVAFKRALETWLPRLLFVFVPLMALLLKLLYLRTGRYYMEHLIFTLHNHAFVFVAMLVMLSVNILAAQANWLTAPAHYFDILVWLYMVVYIFLAMRLFYRQSFLWTLFKFLLAGLLYWIALLVVMSFGSSLILTGIIAG